VRPVRRAGHDLVRAWSIAYPAHDGLIRRAFVVLPRWYGPGRNPRIPLIISPHGRGVSARANVRRWGNLPALGTFATVNPEGQGRKLALFSWGDPGEIADLARMPRIAERALPWLWIERHRVYAFGGSMGGQETLLLVARFPHLLAGAAAFDAPTNLAACYRAFGRLKFGDGLRSLARLEIGGTPATDGRAYTIRSPLARARRINFSGCHSRSGGARATGSSSTRGASRARPVRATRAEPAARAGVAGAAARLARARSPGGFADVAPAHAAATIVRRRGAGAVERGGLENR
jgi:poly(3-hydroxybutyrate) depolymerase